MWMSLQEWKADVISRLSRLASKYPGRRAILLGLRDRVKRCTPRDLSRVLSELSLLSRDFPELVDVIPEPEELVKWARLGT
jgi:hypothetical protein